MISSPAKERLLWADLLRVFAIAAVVTVHVAADVITDWHRVPLSGWLAANFYDSLARGAVPVFVMLSGAFLLSQTESYRDFFKKRLRRILIPFIAWTVFYLLWQKIFYEPSLGFQEAVRRAFCGKVHFHLWFLYLIAGLYLLTPFLRVFTAHASRRDLVYFLGLCFFVASLVPFWENLDSLFFHTGIRFPIPLEAAQGFTGYFVLGFALLKGSRPSLISAAELLWLGCFLGCFLGACWLTLGPDRFPALFYDNLAPNVVLYAASFFVVMKEASPRLEARLSASVKRAFAGLSAASFGIYLIHPVFIDIFDHGRLGFTLSATTGHPLLFIPATVFAVYTGSYLTVLAIRRIPVLRTAV